MLASVDFSNINYGKAAQDAFQTVFGTMKSVADMQRQKKMQDLLLPMEMRKTETEIAVMEANAARIAAQTEETRAAAKRAAHTYERQLNEVSLRERFDNARWQALGNSDDPNIDVMDNPDIVNNDPAGLRDIGRKSTVDFGMAREPVSFGSGRTAALEPSDSLSARPDEDYIDVPDVNLNMFDDLGVAVPQNTASYDPLDPPLPTARGYAEPIGGTTQSAGFSWKESGGDSKAAEMPGWVRDYRAGLASIEQARNATRSTAQRGELSRIDSMAAEDRAVLEAEFEPVAMQHLQQTIQDENEVAFVQNLLNRGASAVKAWEALSNERAQAAARGMKGIGGSRGTSSGENAFSIEEKRLIESRDFAQKILDSPNTTLEERAAAQQERDTARQELAVLQGRADAAQAEMTPAMRFNQTEVPAFASEYGGLRGEGALKEAEALKQAHTTAMFAAAGRSRLIQSVENLTAFAETAPVGDMALGTEGEGRNAQDYVYMVTEQIDPATKKPTRRLVRVDRAGKQSFIDPSQIVSADPAETAPPPATPFDAVVEKSQETAKAKKVETERQKLAKQIAQQEEVIAHLESLKGEPEEKFSLLNFATKEGRFATTPYAPTNESRQQLYRATQEKIKELKAALEQLN